MDRYMELLHPQQGLIHLDGDNPNVVVHKTLWVFFRHYVIKLTQYATTH